MIYPCKIDPYLGIMASRVLVWSGLVHYCYATFHYAPTFSLNATTHSGIKSLCHGGEKTGTSERATKPHMQCLQSTPRRSSTTPVQAHKGTKERGAESGKCKKGCTAESSRDITRPLPDLFNQTPDAKINRRTNDGP